MKKMFGKWGIAVGLLVVCFALTLVNFAFSTWPCEQNGPTPACTHLAFMFCRGWCGGLAYCEYYSWEHNYCDNGLCYEEYCIQCVGGEDTYYQCESMAGSCPKK
jgi:hypothetical protein